MCWGEGVSGLSGKGESHCRVFWGGRVKVSSCFLGACEQSREGEGVMLMVSSSLQTGDPGLETGHLRLLREEEESTHVYMTLLAMIQNFDQTLFQLKICRV